MKSLLLLGLVLAGVFLLGCLESVAEKENISVVCRSAEFETAPAEYFCTFSNNGTSAIPVCVDVKYSGAASLAARICTTVPSQGTVTEKSVLAEAPSSCFKNGEFSCKLEHAWSIAKEAEQPRKKKSEGEAGKEGENAEP